MKIIINKKKLIKLIHRERNLGFVPTMGALHKGHASLIKKSVKECKKTIVSIFVNKPQFNKKSDYKKYPRTLKKDIFYLRKLKVNILFIPTTKQIYPNGRNKKLKINSFKRQLCGKFRPGHFDAVVDVVDRFIKIIKPNKIYFGNKDFQQLLLIKEFSKKNHKNIKIIGCKTVREKNGIALSSRNFLLSKKEKIIASKIYNLLKKSKRSLIRNIKKLQTLKYKICQLGNIKIDYIKILNINKIIKPYRKKIRYKIFVAYYIGKTRLIDNI